MNGIGVGLLLFKGSVGIRVVLANDINQIRIT